MLRGGRPARAFAFACDFLVVADTQLHEGVLAFGLSADSVVWRCGIVGCAKAKSCAAVNVKVTADEALELASHLGRRRRRRRRGRFARVRCLPFRRCLRAIRGALAYSAGTHRRVADFDRQMMG